jgi:hypothetical protein
MKCTNTDCSAWNMYNDCFCSVLNKKEIKNCHILKAHNDKKIYWTKLQCCMCKKIINEKLRKSDEKGGISHGLCSDCLPKYVEEVENCEVKK